MQDQASGEDQSLCPTIFPASIPCWSTRYIWGIQPVTPYWSIVFSFKSKRTGRVILFWWMTFPAALFLSPSIVIKRIVSWSLFPWENCSRADSSCLQACHQVAQKTMSKGFPLKSLRENCFSSNPLREKAGASFFSWNLWIPKEPQDGHSGWEGAAAAAALTAWRQRMSTIIIPIVTESERTIPFFISTSEWKSWAALGRSLYSWLRLYKPFYWSRHFCPMLNLTRILIFSHCWKRGNIYAVTPVDCGLAIVDCWSNHTSFAKIGQRKLLERVEEAGCLVRPTYLQSYRLFGSLKLSDYEPKHG